MAGYWDLAAQQPGIMQNAGAAIANAIAATRERKQRRALAEIAQQEKERELDVREADIAQRGEIERAKMTAASAEAEAKRRANVQRYLAAAAQRGVPQEQMQAAAQRYGVELSQPAALEADAAAVLGYQEPAREVLPVGAQEYEWAFKDVPQENRPPKADWLARQAKAKSSTTNIGIDLTKPTQHELEKEIREGTSTLAMLRDVKRLATPPGEMVPDYESLLSANAKLTNAFGGAVDKYAPSGIKDEALAVAGVDRKELAKVKQFRAIVGYYKTEEFKRLIGSAQTATEVRNLADSILSADMGPVQFAQAMDALERMTMRAQIANREILATGNIAAGSYAYGAAMDSALANEREEIRSLLEDGGQPRGPAQRARRQGAQVAPQQETQSTAQEARYNELIGQGVPEDEAFDRAMGGQ